MVKFDDKQLKAVIEAYKKYISTKIGDEIYKWKAVKCFQDNWDINAEEFIGNKRIDYEHSFSRINEICA